MSVIPVAVSIIGILAMLSFREWFFGPKDGPGFPESRRRHGRSKPRMD
ncbi:MAG: hypothetical protein LBH35_00990 [Treponema sp.]|nr:hypothetical protein [Treponema sp.]